MKITECANNIYSIPVVLPNNPLKAVNCYLIKDPDRSLLIDTGFRMDECRTALLDGLRELGEDAQKIDIFLTHMHSDHAGLASEIIGESGRILISEVDCQLITSVKTEDSPVYHSIADRFRAADMPLSIVDNMSRLNPAMAYSPKSGSGPYTCVRDGDIISVGGYFLRCVLTPGHSPGHMCLWDETAGIMFTGDHVLFDITPNITMWTFIHDSLADYMDSLRFVSKLPVKTALPGHRKPGDFHARIDELLYHHQVRLAEIERLINEKPGSTAYEISGRMNWKIKADNWEVFPPPQKFFAVGECLAHLDYLLHNNRIRCVNDGLLVRYYN